MKLINTKCVAAFLACLILLQTPFSVQASQMYLEDGTIVDNTQTVTQMEFSDGITMEESTKAASSKMSFPKDIKIHTSSASWAVSVLNMPSKGEITNLTISNKKIAKVKNTRDGVNIQPLKVGTATIKFTVKYGSKSKHFTSKLRVYKYVNPISSYKYDGKEIKSNFNDEAFYEVKLNKEKKTKFDVKPKKDWEIVSFRYYCKGISKDYKTNKPTIPLKKVSGSSVQINFRNKKTGLTVVIALCFQ